MEFPWVRDHDQAENKNRARKDNLPRSLTLFANLAISVLHMIGTRNIAEAMERNCYRPARRVRRRHREWCACGAEKRLETPKMASQTPC